MKIKSLNYIMISGFFGFLSIVADQYSYQLEKSISLLEYEQGKQISLSEYGTSINGIAVNMQATLQSQYDHYYETNISEKELAESFNNLKFIFSRQIENLSENDLFVLVAPESLNATVQKNLGFSSKEQNLENDLYVFYDNFWDDLAFMIQSGNKLSSNALGQILDLFDQISDLRFYRQVSLITAICSSFLSLYFIFVFFKRIIRKN